MYKFKKLTLSEVLSTEKRALISGPFGSDISKKFFVKSGVPVIRGNNLTLNSDRFIDNGFVYITKNKANELNAYAQENDLIFTAAGTIGQIGMIPRNTTYPEYVISNKQIRARLNPEIIDYDFAYYWFSSPWITKEIINKNTGSTIPLINLSILRGLYINLPDLQKQKEIASILLALDKKIQINNKINTALETTAKILYDYWFVQFDFPNKEGNPYKSSGGKMVYVKDLNRSIPDGWSVKNLKFFIDKDKSGDWGKEEPVGNYSSKVECIRGADINGINGKGEIKTPTRFILEKNEHKILTTNDLVIEISGGSPTQSTGRLACITAEVSERFENPLICSNFCKAVSLISEEVVFYFTYSWNRAYENGVFFGFEGKTSGIKNLLFDSLVSHYQIPLPDKHLLEQFQEKIAIFEKQKQANLKQNQELASLRDWLLPMLMNGQVTIKDSIRNEKSTDSTVSNKSLEMFDA